MLSGVSMKKACENESTRQRFIREQKRRGEQITRRITPRIERPSSPGGNETSAQCEKISVSEQSLSECEKLFLGLLSARLKMGDISIMRICLDFLKARYRPYQEKTSHFTPDDYKAVWLRLKEKEEKEEGKQC
jgi:hypothetical protein